MHWRNKMRKLLFSLIFGTLFFAGCAGTSGPAGHPAQCSDKLYGVKWRLVMIDNDTVSLRKPPFIRFSRDGGVGGFGGCNSFFGEASVTQTAIDFEKIGSTRRYCSGMNGEVERRFFAVLKGIKWWQFDEEENLVIFDDEHRLVLEKSGE